MIISQYFFGILICFILILLLNFYITLSFWKGTENKIEIKKQELKEYESNFEKKFDYVKKIYEQRIDEVLKQFFKKSEELVLHKLMDAQVVREKLESIEKEIISNIKSFNFSTEDFKKDIRENRCKTLDLETKLIDFEKKFRKSESFIKDIDLLISDIKNIRTYITKNQESEANELITNLVNIKNKYVNDGIFLETFAQTNLERISKIGLFENKEKGYYELLEKIEDAKRGM